MKQLPKICPHKVPGGCEYGLECGDCGVSKKKDYDYLNCQIFSEEYWKNDVPKYCPGMREYYDSERKKERKLCRFGNEDCYCSWSFGYLDCKYFSEWYYGKKAAISARMSE